MGTHVALLRAVNVGGTGKLPMATLVKMCAELGFERARTYIASGNAVFSSRLRERKIKALLEERLADYAGKPVGVLVRSAEEMAAALAANPFRSVPSHLQQAPWGRSEESVPNCSPSAHARSTLHTRTASRTRSW